MDTYSFAVTVTGVSVDGGAYEDAFHEAGCDDALNSVVDGAL